MILVRKSKVEKSPHFEEIVLRLSKGESARSVSKWLKNSFNEDISHAALARYAKNKITMEERVEAELNRRAEEKKLKEERAKKEAIKEKVINNEVNVEADVIEKVNSVAETIANNMQGVAKVAAQFPSKFQKACADAKNPESNVTSKDVARISLDANKLYNDYFKQDGTNFEVNIENNTNLSHEFNEEKMRKILDAKQKRDK